MNVIALVKLQNGQTRKYPLKAKDKEDAIKQLKLRLHPNDRETCEILSIKEDLSKPADIEPFGEFLGE